jgi:hypothetical protein
MCKAYLIEVSRGFTRVNRTYPEYLSSFLFDFFFLFRIIFFISKTPSNSGFGSASRITWGNFSSMTTVELAYRSVVV